MASPKGKAIPRTVVGDCHAHIRSLAMTGGCHGERSEAIPRTPSCHVMASEPFGMLRAGSATDAISRTAWEMTTPLRGAKKEGGRYFRSGYT